jgi:predicted RNase H-like nuclease (RuvC/YqgF family)
MGAYDRQISGLNDKIRELQRSISNNQATERSLNRMVDDARRARDDRRLSQAKDQIRAVQRESDRRKTEIRVLDRQVSDLKRLNR